MTNNILLVANWDSNVGYAWWLIENFWAAIANEFSNKQHKSLLIYPSISKIPPLIEQSPIDILQHDFNDHSIGGTFKLIQIIRKNNIRYLYLSDKSETSILYLILKLFGVKKIFIHDHTPGERPKLFGLKKVLKKLYKRIPLINADVFIAVTDYIRNRMIYSSGLPPEKCHVAKNGINPIGRDPQYRYYAHDTFNLPHDSLLIVTTGRANFYKRIDFLIEVFAKVLARTKSSNLYFIYCGEGPHLEDFKRLASKLGLDKKFIFAGRRNDIPQLLQSCNIGIQASHGEVGYSLSILEYMSAGLATLVPNNPSVCQSITDEFDGIHFEFDNQDALCEKFLQLINDEQSRKKLGNNAITTIENNYTLQNTNRELINIISTYIN